MKGILVTLLVELESSDAKSKISDKWKIDVRGEKGIGNDGNRSAHKKKSGV